LSAPCHQAPATSCARRRPSRGRSLADLEAKRKPLP
jgi:hypothetical protein